MWNYSICLALAIGDIHVQGRTTQGVAVMKIGADDMVKSCAVLKREDALEV